MVEHSSAWPAARSFGAAVHAAPSQSSLRRKVCIPGAVAAHTFFLLGRRAVQPGPRRQRFDGHPRGHVERPLARQPLNRHLRLQGSRLKGCPKGHEQVVERRHVGAACDVRRARRQRHLTSCSRLGAAQAPPACCFPAARRSQAMPACMARQRGALGPCPPVAASHQLRVLSSKKRSF